MKKSFYLFIAVIGFFLTSQTLAVQLVSDETISKQKKLTSQHTLKNGIKVNYRQVPSSDIIQVSLKFSSGQKDISPKKKAMSHWLWSVMPMAAKGFPKKKVFELTEKYALQLGCAGGTENSGCALGTLNEYWAKALPLFSAIVQTPALTKEDAKLVKDRSIASLKSEVSEPGKFINDVINRIFYPAGHPYRLSNAEALKGLEALTLKEIKEYHASLVNAAGIQITVVGSLPTKKLLADLNKYFGKVKKSTLKGTGVPAPKYDAKNAFIIEDRDVPTAYIRAKMVGPSVTDKDSTAASLMFEIMSRELHEEVRTKRSLSYSVFSYIIPYTMGIGVIGASTSKPKETLEAIQVIINKMKTHTYSKTDLEEYKNIFITEYFLTQETHASLSGSIARSSHYFGSADYLYDLPVRLSKVTPADIKRIANKTLKNMKLGVIFSKKKFDKKWATKFIEANKG